MKQNLKEELLKQLRLINYDRSNTLYDKNIKFDKIIKKVLEEQKEITIKGQKVPLEIVRPISDTETGGLSRAYKDKMASQQIVKNKLKLDKPNTTLPKVTLSPVVSNLFDTWFGTSKERQKKFGDWLILKGVKFKNPKLPKLNELRYHFSLNNNKLGEEYFLTLDKNEQERWKKWKESELPKLQKFYRAYGNDIILRDLDDIDINSDSQQVSMFRGSGTAYILSNLTDFVAKIFKDLNTNFYEEDKEIKSSIGKLSSLAAQELGYKDKNQGLPINLPYNNTWFNTPNSLPISLNPSGGFNFPNLGLSLGLAKQTINYTDGSNWKVKNGVWTQVASSEPLFDPKKEKIMNWVEKQIDNITPGEIIDFYNIFGKSFTTFLNAKSHRESIAKEMKWSSPSVFTLKSSNMDELSKVSRTTTIDTSFIIAVDVLNTLQEIFQQLISRLYNFKMRQIKNTSKMSANEKAQYIFDNLFSLPGVYEDELLKNYHEYFKLITDINKINEQINLQIPSRELNPENPNPNKVSNLQACSKTESTKINGEVVTYLYSMTEVCKNYGGLWVDGPTNAKRCCCADIPKEKTIVNIIPKFAQTTKILKSGAISKQSLSFINIKVNLTKSCEAIKDVRTIGEKVNDTIDGCKTDYHCWLDLASVVSLAVPGYGLIISFVVDSVNAAAYLVEAGLAEPGAERTEALMGAGFSILGAALGGGGGLTVNSIKGYPRAVKSFGNDFSKMVYEIYGKGSSKTLGKIEKEEIEGAWEMLVKKHGLKESESQLAKNYLEQVKSLNPNYLQKYSNKLEEIRDKIGLANFRRIGGEKKFIEILGKENGDVLKALNKYVKSNAGKEFLQESGLFAYMSYKLPEIMQDLNISAAETGKRPIIGGDTALSTMVQVDGYDLKNAQNDFGSDRTSYDNKLMRSAWLSGWRPGFTILTIDEKDFTEQFNKQKNLGTLKITPKFIQNKNFGKYATATLKQRLVSQMMDKLENEYQKQGIDRIKTVKIVDDNKFGESTRYDDEIVVPKGEVKKFKKITEPSDRVKPKEASEVDDLLKSRNL